MTTKKEMFVNFVEALVSNTSDADQMADFHEAMDYLEKLKKEQTEKPLFTDNGIIILDALQKLDGSIEDGHLAKDIADHSGLNPRTVSGAVRKLVADGYAEVVATGPNQYAITDKGREVDLTAGRGQ